MGSDQNRDDLDLLLAKAAHALRQPRGLPTPGPGEPSDDLLLRVASGAATPEERAVVEGAGPYARERLEVLREALAETGHAPSVAERAARYVFVLAKDALELLRSATEPLAPAAPLAVRSGAAAAPARPTYHEFVQPLSGAVEAHLKVEHVVRASQGSSVDVQVKLTGASGLRVSLLRGGVTLDSVPVAEGGAATFSGLGEDRYEIVVRKTGPGQDDQPLGRLHLDLLKS